ncbi:MAG: hypothetical protein IJQ31_09995 [Thermoguttaceae bacterium]|nr:hypothetical protein [Thermoguttaceae bacterium]
MRFSPIPVFLFCFVLSTLTGFTSAAEDSARVYTVFKNLEAKYADKLEELAKWCDEKGLDGQAETTRNWAKPVEPDDEIRVSPLPDQFQEWNQKGKAAPAKTSMAKDSKSDKSAKSGSKSKSKSKKDGKRSRSSGDDDDDAAGNDSSAPFGEWGTGITDDGTVLPPKDPKLVAEWENQFRMIRLNASKDYLKLAKKAVSTGHVTFGFGLLMRTLREDPDCEAARKILGYSKTKTGWVTDFEKMQMKMGNVWHETYGWIPKKFVQKYEDGQRYLNGKWVTAEQDAEYHSTIERGWVVLTGHFEIITDASLEAGVQTGKKLEQMYRVWKQLFLNYYATEQQIRSLFETGSAKFTPIPRHRVLLFKTSEEYVSYLTSKNMYTPGSAGVYVHRRSGKKREGAACFSADSHDDHTMYHEVTHQLFEESCETAPGKGSKQNYWVVEAASTFMESFHEAEDGTLAVGGFNSSRMKGARIYAVNMDQFIPFEEFVLVTGSKWSEKLRNDYYCEACGMANFLVFYDHGRYRDVFGRMLFDVYSGRDTKESLTKLTGADWETLNREYKEYISQDADAIKGYSF